MSAVTSQMLLSLGLAFFCVVGSARPAGHSLTPKQVTTAHRPAKSLFQSEPGNPHALQIAFDPQTQRVTVTLSVEDPDGYFIPNLRPENFAVYEDGVLQKGATVDVEHAAVSMSVLLEGGGRYQELNQLLSTEIPVVARPLLSSLIRPEEERGAMRSNGIRGRHRRPDGAQEVHIGERLAQDGNRTLRERLFSKLRSAGRHEDDRHGAVHLSQTALQ